MASNIKACRPEAALEGPEHVRKKPAERLTRNVAAAALLLLAAVAVRETGTGGSGILETVKQAVESQWDQNVGRLTYVSGTLAESIQVFGNSGADGVRFYAPVATQAVQTWSAAAPYLGYENPGIVYAAARGEVTQIVHDDDELYIVRVNHNNGMDTIYYGLESCFVQEGDPVDTRTALGEANTTLAFQVQKNGQSLDYTDRMKPRSDAP